MHGPSHLIIGWFTAEAAGLSSPRHRRIVAWSGFAPDFDVLAYLGAIVYYGFDKNLAFKQVWQVVHHRYTHGLGFVMLIGMVTFLIASRGNRSAKPANGQPMQVAVLSMTVAMIHIFCDVVAGGPTWPIYPIWPVSDVGWATSWSWTLADWPNTVILFACLFGMMWYAKYAGHSPLESLNYRLDRWFVTIIQQGSSEHVSEEDGTPVISTSPKRQIWIRVLVYLLLILLVIAVLAPLGFQINQLNLPRF